MEVQGHGAQSSPAHADPIGVEVNALQHENSEGPCLDAITDRIIVYATTYATTHRVADDVDDYFAT